MRNNYSETFFGKPLLDLVYQDIVDYFATGKDETNHIEFKAFYPDKKIKDQYSGILKSISAFLNSEGGILIWGAPLGQVPGGAKEKVFEGDLSPIAEILEKDALVNKISDSISPLPETISVNILERDGKCICVFDIPSSNYAPHQYKNIYYMRLDGQSRPAPHHYIDALYRRAKYPNLEGYIVLSESHSGQNSNYEPLFKLYLSVKIFNFSGFRNEENLTYVLACSEGTFEANDQQRGETELSKERNRLTRRQVVETLHFGLPKTEDIELIMALPFSDRGKVEIPIYLLFGGKFAPMKVSSYSFVFELGENQNRVDIKPLQENVLLSQSQMDRGIGRREILASHLGRDIP